MQDKRTHRLPDGKFTTDEIKYCRAWERLAKPICKLTGAKLHAIDPDIQIRFSSEGSRFGSIITLPPQFLMILNKALEEKNNEY